MHDQLSLEIDRKLQNSLILSMKSGIEERIRQSAITILQLLYAHFHQDQQLQPRRSSTTSFEAFSQPLPSLKKPAEEPNDTQKTIHNNTNNSSIKVSALVAHYSSSDLSPSSINVSIKARAKFTNS